MMSLGPSAWDKLSVNSSASSSSQFLSPNQTSVSSGSDLWTLLLTASVNNISDANFTDLLRKLANKSKGDEFKKILDYLNLYLTPVIILVGVIGNVMSFLVFCVTHLQRLSSSVYLASLSVVDTGFLLALLVVWLGRINVAIFSSDGWCQCTVYLTHVFSFLSVWYVVSFTIERYIIVYHPLRKDAFCTKRRAKLVVSCLGLFALLMYTYVLWTSGVIKIDQQANVCMPLPHYYDILTIMTSIDTFLACILPSLVIVILNVRIILKLHQYQIRRNQFANGQLILPKEKHPRRSVIQTSISTTGSMHIKFASSNKQDEPQGEAPPEEEVTPDNCQRVLRSRSQYRTARMLLILSSVFVLLNLPSHIFRVLAFVQHIVGGQTKTTRRKIRWQELFQLVYFLNFAINFFIYSACGRQFRVALRRLCSRFAREGTKLKSIVRFNKPDKGEITLPAGYGRTDGRNNCVLKLQKVTQL